jgi:hypothetical protein
MADGKERFCAVCRLKYKYCPRCPEDRNKELWHFTFHELNCKNIYDVLSAYEDGRLSANVAKAQLENLDLSKIENFGESYKKSIAKISDEIKNDSNGIIKKKTVKQEELIEKNPVEENTVSENVIEEIKVEEENTNKVKNYRKSKKRTNTDVED